MANHATAKLISGDHLSKGVVFKKAMIFNDGKSAWRWWQKKHITRSKQAFIEVKGRENAMANHKSSKKRIIRNANRAMINGARMGRIRTFVKKVETAIAAGDAEGAREALRKAQPEMQRGVSRGILHKNTVSRKISRLSARVKALAA
jgi:small subunit ribosomal protein S20